MKPQRQSGSLAMLKRRDVSYVQPAVMRFSQYIAAIFSAADAELTQTRSSRIRRVARGTESKVQPDDTST
jgi:hypothetical protein